MEFHTDSPASLPGIAAEILMTLPGARFFAIYGKMGAGKTTLVHAFLKQLGVEEHGSSPSFSIVNTYETKDGVPVYHFDFYRIESQEEVFDIGYEEYFYGSGYCFAEWPEKIGDLLPHEVVSIFIEDVGDGREIVVSD